MTNLEYEKSVEQTILKIGHEIYAAIQRKDADAIERFLAADFVYRTGSGIESSRTEFLNGIKEMPFELSSVTGEHERVSVYGDIAIMTGVQLAEWRQGETAHGLNSAAFVDVFARRDQDWLLVPAFGVDLPA